MQVEVTTAENLSNLTWLVFAGASLLFWSHKVRPLLGTQVRRSLCALTCVLLLMFPVISLSDDLHPDLVIAAEGDGKSKLLKGPCPTASAPASRAVASAWAESQAQFQIHAGAEVFARIVAADTTAIPFCSASPSGSRAPPSLFHA